MFSSISGPSANGSTLKVFNSAWRDDHFAEPGHFFSIAVDHDPDQEFFFDFLSMVKKIEDLAWPLWMLFSKIWKLLKYLKSLIKLHPTSNCNFPVISLCKTSDRSLFPILLFGLLTSSKKFLAKITEKLFLLPTMSIILVLLVIWLFIANKSGREKTEGRRERKKSMAL